MRIDEDPSGKADFITRVWEAERLVNFGRNVDLYRQLTLNSDRFPDSTWEFGVNSLFLGPSVFGQIASARVLHGKRFPDEYTHDGQSFGLRFDQIRVLEIVAGSFMPPQNWEDLFLIADQMRTATGENMEYNRHQFEKVRPEQREKVLQLVEDGVNLSTKPGDVEIFDIIHALIIKRDTIHMQEVGNTLDIVTELLKENLLTEPEENKRAFMQFR